VEADFIFQVAGEDANHPLLEQVGPTVFHMVQSVEADRPLVGIVDAICLTVSSRLALRSRITFPALASGQTTLRTPRSVSIRHRLPPTAGSFAPGARNWLFANLLPISLADFQHHFKEIAKACNPVPRPFYVHLTSVIVSVAYSTGNFFVSL
jgi:hypothetical protein